MKKLRKKTLFIATLLFLVITLPYLIDLKFVGDSIEKAVKKESGIDISIEKTHWYWLPKPGFFLQNTTIKNQALQSNIRLIAVYPRFTSLFRGEITIKEVELITPEINILSLDKLSRLKPDGTDKPEGFPEITLSVSNGNISIPFEGHLAVLNDQVAPLSIAITDLEMSSYANTIELMATVTTPFASKITSKNRLTRNSPQEPQGKYKWTTSIHADNLDFSQIKKAALILFGGDEDVHEVFDNIYRCDIRKAGLVFEGTSADFSNMDNLIVTAEIDNTDYHIPDTKVVLTNGKGSLRVEDAVLHGSDLTASLKNSHGTNGRFFLGLAEDDFRFKLNFDIDADLSELHENIDEFIESPELKQEVEKVKNLTGRTLVNLKLADDLNDLRTYLFLPSLSGSFHYDLLQRDIVLNKGVLDISPESVTWSDLDFNAGVNTLKGISGSVNLKDEALLNLTGKTIEVDTRDVYQIVTALQKPEDRIKNVITGIDGNLTLSEINISGPVLKAGQINFDLVLSSDAVTVSSPHLPGSTKLSFSSLSLSDNTVKTDQLNALFKDTSLSASINLNHDVFDTFHGSIIINGATGENISPWLKKKGWFHQSVFPRLPCSLSPLSLLITEKDLAVTGNIIHKKDINTLVDMKLKDKKEISGTIEILSGEKNAVIKLLSSKSSNVGSIGIAFEGEVEKKDLNSIIYSDWFPGDSLEGEFNLLYPVVKNLPARLNGSAEIKGFSIPLSQNGELLFDTLKIDGHNDYADIFTGNSTLISPDNLKGKVKEKLNLSGLSSKLYFQYNEAALLRVLSGNVCGINFRGDLNLPSKKLDFKVSLGKKKQSTFAEVFSCLGLKNTNISGNVTINSEFKGSAKNLSGSRLQLKANRGIIKEATLLAKILSLIDLTELFKKNPVKILQATGYHYDDIEVDAVISGQELKIIRGKIIGSGLNLYGTGKIDLKTGEIDMIILASPLKTIDNIISSLPIIGEKVTGDDQSVLSVPIKVEGTLSHPEIRFLPKKVSSVSSGLIDVFMKTFKLPFKLSHKLVKPIQKQLKKKK